MKLLLITFKTFLFWNESLYLQPYLGNLHSTSCLWSKECRAEWVLRRATLRAEKSGPHVTILRAKQSWGTTQSILLPVRILHGRAAGLTQSESGPDYWLDDRGFPVRFAPWKVSRPAMPLAKPHTPAVLGVLSPGKKRPRFESDHSPHLIPSINLLTYSMEQSPWEANRFSASQEFPRILWNRKVNYCIQKCQSPVPILSQLDPVHIPTSYFLKIHLNIILPSTSGSPKWYFSFGFSHQNPAYASPLPHTRYMPRP